MKIPYGIYFMSCNLEHVLFDQLNCTNEAKEEMSYRFSRRFSQKSDFQTFITESDFAVRDSYSNSWKFIQRNAESLKRHTNLGLSWLEAPATES